MNALPAPFFAACFTAWVESLRETAPDIVAIDGKTSRQSKAKGSAPRTWSRPGQARLSYQAPPRIPLSI